ETVAGFGVHVPGVSSIPELPGFIRRYFERFMQVLGERARDPQTFLSRQFAQAQTIRSRYTWSIRAKEWEAALPAWRRLGKSITGPATIGAALEDARTRLQQGHPAEADDVCRRIIEAVPHEPEAHRLRGLAAYFQQRYEEAATLLRQAISLSPNNPEYY